MLMLIFYHGLRVTELCRLRRQDVDLTHGRIWIQRIKGSLSTEQPLHPDELRTLKHYLGTLGNSTSHAVRYSRSSHPGGRPMELTDSRKTLLSETAKSLQGSARRVLLARTVNALGRGGPHRAARALRWGRMTMRQGLPELARGVMGVDAVAWRGRQRADGPLPALLTAIRAIVASQSPAAPQVRANRLSTRLTAAEVRRQLIAHQGSTAAPLPTADTMGLPWHALGDAPHKGATSPPQKHSRQPTDALCDQRAHVQQAADTAATV